jgi:hypothetical protein
MTKALAYLCALVVFAFLAAAASGGGMLPTRTLFNTRGADGRSYKLVAQFERRGRAYLTVALSSSAGGASDTHFTADKKHPFRLYGLTADDPCRDVAVFGSVTLSVRKLVAVRKNGTKHTIALQKPPASWHYKGRLVGAFTGDGSPTVRLRVFGRRGHQIGVFPVPNDLEPACSTPGQT